MEGNHDTIVVLVVVIGILVLGVLVVRHPSPWGKAFLGVVPTNARNDVDT